MFLNSFTDWVQNSFKWFAYFCKEYGLLIIVVGLFVYGSGFLIALLKGVYDNHKSLVELITRRESSAMTFQKACVDDFDSKQKMEQNRVKTDSIQKDNKLSDDSIKLDSRQKLKEIEDNMNDVIGLKTNAEQDDRKLIE